MKKFIFSLTCFCLIALLAIVSVGFVSKTKAATLALSIFSTNSNNPQAANSTTTVTYLVAGQSTSTLAFNTTTSNQEQVFIQFAASSTAAVLNWQYEFSNDNVNWFEEDIPANPTLANGIAVMDHASTTITHRWLPGTVSTSSKAVLLPNISSKFTRVKFFIPTGGASGAVWAQAVATAFYTN